MPKHLMLLMIIALTLPGLASAQEDNTTIEPDNEKKSGVFSLFKDKEISFFPIPVIETRPDEGQSYGAMPVVLFSDKETKSIDIILAALAQYNSVIKFSAAGIFYYFPDTKNNPNAFFQFYFEFAQKYYRELEIIYYDPLTQR